jgi:hypothetical protein
MKHLSLRVTTLIISLTFTTLNATTLITFKDITEGYNGDLKFTTLEVSPDHIKTTVITNETSRSFEYSTSSRNLILKTSHPKETLVITPEQASLFKKQMNLAATDYEGFKKTLSLQEQALLSSIPKVSLPCMITKLSPERIYQLSEVGVSMNRWSCSHYKVMSKGTLIEEVWVTAFPLIKLNTSDFDVFKKFPDEYLTLLQAQISAIIPNIRIPFPEPSANGFPVKRIRYQDGKAIHTTQLLKVQTK